MPALQDEKSGAAERTTPQRRSRIRNWHTIAGVRLAREMRAEPARVKNS